MKLYEGWRSSASWRVRWALALKKIPHESVLVDIDRKEHFEVLATLNPMRQLPTLEWIARGLIAFEEQLAGLSEAFCAGDQMSMADLYLVPQVRNADRFEADISKCTRIREIYSRCMATPEARATDPNEVKKRAT